MNLFVTSLTIVDLDNKKAAKIKFNSRKVFITSKSNHLGKSVIMKSIYHTLGAEAFFSNTIKNINVLSYIDFNLGTDKYRVCRLKNTFLIYLNSNLFGKFYSVSDYQEALSEVFRFEIDLVGKDEEKSIIKCPPAFYFLPYYVDQENGWTIKSESFDRLTEFDLNQRKDSYFFHLGVFDRNYVKINKDKKANSKRETELKKEIERLKTVIDTLNTGESEINMNFDIDSLESSIKRRKKEIQDVLYKIEKIRAKLVEKEDRLFQIEHDKNVLSKYINKKVPFEEKEIELVECPKCGTHFDHILVDSMKKKYILESLNSDYAILLNEEKNISVYIERSKKSFIEYKHELEKLENDLKVSNNSYDLYIQSKATAQLLQKYHNKICEDNAEIERIIKENSDISRKISLYNKEKDKTNADYIRHFNKMSITLDVPSEQVGSYVEPGSPISASGAYGPRCKIAQLLSFVKSHQEKANDIISFPIVIDSPNTLEQDDAHIETVMETLFGWNETKNQIIIASIKGKTIALRHEDVQIIELTNEKNQVMQEDVYIKNEFEINNIFMDF